MGHEVFFPFSFLLFSSFLFSPCGLVILVSSPAAATAAAAAIAAASFGR